MKVFMKKNLFYILFFIILIITGCTNFKINDDIKIETSYLDTLNTKEEYAFIDEYTIYGRFFNISGEIELSLDNLVLVLKNKDIEIEYNLVTEVKNNKTKFKTNELINTGINLENIQVGKYVFLLKDSNNNYYSLKNKTSYSKLEYYTLTKDNKNNLINISFEMFSKKSYLYLNCSLVSSNLNDIYDIVIDPGHGGNDSGAINNGYYESKINLDYAKTLKKELESTGLKVKLTRESDVFLNNYGVNSRVSVPYEVKAKLLLSIHMNSSSYNLGLNGVEIYVANNSSLEFASNLAKEIVDLTSSSYSSNNFNKVLNGVYIRTFSQSDIDNINDDALKNNYTPYENISLDTNYYYIIRETGGIVTGAYVDSRNDKITGNPYVLSNVGTESYLLELGYLSNLDNLNNIIDNMDKYVEGIAVSINSLYKEN